jgi:hypothetical protein
MEMPLRQRKTQQDRRFSLLHGLRGGNLLQLSPAATGAKIMSTTSATPPRRIAAAIIAILFTVAIHGGWLSGMDRDAIAVISPQA